MASKILNFSPNRLITGINIVDNMLFYTDGENEPKKINIEKFRGTATTGEFKDIPVDHSSGNTYIYNRPFEERDITVIKDHPAAFGKKIESTLLIENFGNAEDDLSVEDITTTDIEIIDESGSVSENPSGGTTSVEITSSTLDNTSFEIKSVYGDGDVVESGLIWSQTDKNLKDLVNNVGTTSNKVISPDNSINSGTLISNVSLTKNDTNSPNHAADLTAGDIHAASFVKLKGNDSIKYSYVKEANVTDESASSTAPIGLRTNEPSKIDSETYKFSATYDSDGGSPIIDAGFLFSKPLINTTYGSPPTVEDLINGNGFDISADIDGNEISLLESPLFNRTYYYVPYIENKNGRIYGEDLIATDSVTKKIKPLGTLRAMIDTSPVLEYSDDGSSLFLEGRYDGNKNNILKNMKPASAAGFYFSVEKDQILDIVNSSFTNGQSSDGKSFKIDVTNADLENGGTFKLDISEYITLLPGQKITYAAYYTDDSGETWDSPRNFTLPKPLEDPVASITSASWGFSNEGVTPANISPYILINYNLDIAYFDPNATLDDVGIIVSKPWGDAEYKRASLYTNNGVWSNLKDVINDKNNIKAKKSLKDLTFTSHNNSNTIGRYNTTAPFKMPNMWDSKEFEYLSKNNIKPGHFNFSAVGYVISNGKTYYTNVFNINNKNINFNTSNEINARTLGAPQVKTISTSEQSYSDVAHNTAKIYGKLHKIGSAHLQEIGFYISETDPSSFSSNGIAVVSHTGRSKDLDDWSLSATKYYSDALTNNLNISIIEARNHTNQDVNEFLNFETNVTGLLPEKKYYFAAYSKPTPSGDTKGDIVYGNGESLNSITNATRWGNVKQLVTTKNMTGVTLTDPLPKILVKYYKNLDKPTSSVLGYEISVNSKDHSFNSAGFYLKPVSGFTSMTDPSNRLQFTQNPSQTAVYGSEYSAGLRCEPLQAIDYYAAAYVDIIETGEQIISDTVLIKKSVDAVAVTPPAEIQTFLVSPPGNTMFGLGGGSSAPAAYKNQVKGTIKFNKPITDATTGSGIPNITDLGFYFLENSNLSKPSSVDNFVSEYNNVNSSFNKSSVSNGDGGDPSLDGLTIDYVLSFPTNNFPSAIVGKKYYTIGYAKYGDGTFKYSDNIEEIYIKDPTKTSNGKVHVTEVNYDGIFYSAYDSTRSAVSAVFKGGVNVTPSDLITKARAGMWKPDKLTIQVQSTADWFMYVTRHYEGWFGRTRIQQGLGTPGETAPAFLPTLEKFYGNSFQVGVKRNANSIDLIKPTPNTNRKSNIQNITTKIITIYILPEEARKLLINYPSTRNKSNASFNAFIKYLEGFALEKIGVHITGNRF